MKSPVGVQKQQKFKYLGAGTVHAAAKQNKKKIDENATFNLLPSQNVQGQNIKSTNNVTVTTFNKNKHATKVNKKNQKKCNLKCSQLESDRFTTLSF